MNASPATRPARDRRILYATAFLRALSTGLIGVLLGIYLAKLLFDAVRIGYVIAAGLAGGAVAPSFAGALMQGVSLGVPLVIGAGMKIAYDLLLYAAFRKAKPPEETAQDG